MRVLVLDTIHGGREIGAAFRTRGDDADEVDVYRDEGPVRVEDALSREYDLVTAPVHLDPGSPLLKHHRAGVISHHEAVRLLLGRAVPHPFVEITGGRGKTTTAHLLAALLPGPGILHTTRGTVCLPGGELLWRKSITPASILPAVRIAAREGRWLVAEVSLGVTGAGDLALLTSGEDYLIAAGRKSALDEKKESLRDHPRVIVAPGVSSPGPGSVSSDTLVHVDGDSLTYESGGKVVRVIVPLLKVPGYQVPVVMAAAAALILGVNPARLAEAVPVEGRMQVKRMGALLVVDNSGSGSTGNTATVSAAYARTLGSGPLTLVIGQEGLAVCEGFPEPDLVRAVQDISPDRLILVEPSKDAYRNTALVASDMGIPCSSADRLADAEKMAVSLGSTGIILLTVKTWR